jgi:hypothetical protein
MSDSDFGAVTRYANNLDIIDNDWMQDEISEAEVGTDIIAASHFTMHCDVSKKVDSILYLLALQRLCSATSCQNYKQLPLALCFVCRWT